MLYGIQQLQQNHHEISLNFLCNFWEEDRLFDPALSETGGIPKKPYRRSENAPRFFFRLMEDRAGIEIRPHDAEAFLKIAYAGSVV